MNGTLLTLAAVSAIALAARVRSQTRGSRAHFRYYHVTSLKNAHAILSEGFRPTEGICGMGVYVWDDVVLAEEMLSDVEDGVLLGIDPGEASVEVCDASDVEGEGDSNYYEHVGIVRVKRGETWVPRSIRVLE